MCHLRALLKALPQVEQSPPAHPNHHTDHQLVCQQHQLGQPSHMGRGHILRINIKANTKVHLVILRKVVMGPQVRDMDLLILLSNPRAILLTQRMDLLLLQLLVTIRLPLTLEVAIPHLQFSSLMLLHQVVLLWLVPHTLCVGLLNLGTLETLLTHHHSLVQIMEVLMWE